MLMECNACKLVPLEQAKGDPTDEEGCLGDCLRALADILPGWRCMTSGWGLRCRCEHRSQLTRRNTDPSRTRPRSTASLERTQTGQRPRCHRCHRVCITSFQVPASG